MEKGWKRKGNDCFSGRHWSIVNAACSFSWPVTCIVVGLLVWGGQTAGGRWGADGQLGQFGEKERKSREWEHKREKWERQREVSVLWKSGEVERGAEGSRGDRGPWSSIASLSPLLLCVSRDEGMTHSSTHRQPVWESTRRVADACSLCPCYSATAKTVCACERENVVVLFFWWWCWGGCYDLSSIVQIIHEWVDMDIVPINWLWIQD